MAELSIGNTSSTDCDNNDEAKVCPLCLDPVPPVSWKLDFRKRCYYCGGVVCSKCTVDLLKRGKMARKALDRGEVLDDKQIADIKAVASAIRCPTCRTTMPNHSNGESLAMLQGTIERHPNWGWPLRLMGEQYESGNGCPQDLEKSFFYFKKAAERGDVRSQNKIGDFYCFGLGGVAQSTQDAIYWYTLACKQGFALSQYTLGHIYYDQGNYDEAFRLLSLAAEQGMDKAQCLLGTCYQQGLGVAPSIEKLLYWYKEAAKQDNTTAMYNYAQAIEALNADGVVDAVGDNAVPEALYWARKAAFLGYEEAARLVSKLEDLSPKHEDIDNCFFYHHKAAERGDVRSQNKMGDFYWFGNDVVAKSTQDAIYWYTLACQQGCASSQCNLGLIYFDQGNYDEAFRLLSLAAEQGVDKAQCTLATCYQKGLGVAPSIEKFLYWNKKAAEQGNAMAMNNYALFIMTQASKAHGAANLVGKDAVPEALYWARKAAFLGYEDAASVVSRLEVVSSTVCANCQRTKNDYPTMNLSLCSQCKASAYCSKECQAAHWRKGHKWDCIDRNGVKKSKNTTRKGR